MNRPAPHPATPRAAGTATCALLALLVSGGCATFAPAPERPPYGGTDQVGEVSPGSLVGTWRVTPLNPFPEQRAQETVIEYRADGSVTGRVDPDERSLALMGEDARFEITGRWSVEGGLVTHDGMEVDVVSGNALANVVGGIVGGAMSDVASRADVYELGTDRVVMVGDDGAAMRYERL